ncbi:hypothetical protein FRC12_019842 [Ceratobasidium sp. 428]|nr:hypothetical protein FRC12_019842 [Ceratobasidium sp. 428]
MRGFDEVARRPCLAQSKAEVALEVTPPKPRSLSHLDRICCVNFSLTVKYFLDMPLLRSQAVPPSGNTRSRARASNNATRRDITAPSKAPRSKRSSRAVSSGAKGKGRARSSNNRDDENQDDESQEDEDRALIDMRAAEAGVDQAHIVDDPEWKLVDMFDGWEQREQEIPEAEDTPMEVEYREELEVTLYKLLETDRMWIELGPGLLSLEANLDASRAIVRMTQTHRVLAHWSIFGGMKVVRFLTTIIVVAIITEDGAQKIVTYGLKVATLKLARELAMLLSSNSYGMQNNLERLIPKFSEEQRARILESMTDRLLILQRRLGTLNNNSELSARVESELTEMFAEVKH